MKTEVYGSSESQMLAKSGVSNVEMRLARWGKALAKLYETVNTLEQALSVVMSAVPPEAVQKGPHPRPDRGSSSSLVRSIEEKAEELEALELRIAGLIDRLEI